MRPEISQRGIAIVEFVIVLPLLIFLILVVSEVGRAFVQYTVLANSVRDAARYAASNAIDTGSGVITLDDALRTATRNIAVYGNAAGSGTPGLPSYAPSQVTLTADASNNVTVTAVYPYSPLFSGGIPGPGLPPAPVTTAFNMQIAVTMRAL